MPDYRSDLITCHDNYRYEAVREVDGVARLARENRPLIVCLCGSSRFKAAFEAANRAETLAGKIVLGIGMFGHGEGLDMNGPVKEALDKLHLWKIRLADEVLVLNIDGYIGESTRREIAFAEEQGKIIRYLES